jgi:hypothetical protein
VGTAAGTPHVFTAVALKELMEFVDRLPFAVGKNPEPVPSVWRSHIVCAEHTPFRIVPETGQVPENNVESPRFKGCDVLHDDVAWS